jgi:hypothetical protein
MKKGKGWVLCMRNAKATLLIAVFVVVSSVSWTQIAPTKPSATDPPAMRSGERVVEQSDQPLPVPRPGPGWQRRKAPVVIKEFKHDTGPPLREVAPLFPELGPRPEHEIENNVNPNHRWRNLVQKDPVLQTEENSPRLQTPSFGLEFDGIGFDGNFFCYCMPPDNDGAVGTTQYVQFTNDTYQVFDKSGNSLLSPLAGNAFWSGFGGSCESDNSGDPVMRFDAAAQRWVVSQFALNNSAPDYECVAVSTTDDATGSYNRYAFPFNDFPDYPKLGVWPDAYYFTFNNFDITGSYFVGANVCAADRSQMLTGAAATMQCFQQDTSHFGLLPSDLDGSTPPAAGTPNFMMELDPSGSANLDLFKFHVDFTTPANSTFTGPTLIPVAAFTPLCNGYYRGDCVPQPTADSDQLEALGDRLMWRLVYRNFSDHSTLLVSHSIVAGSSGGVRWYEIHNPETSPAVFQSGTFAPDSQYRWMPAIAMDQNQDIGVGFTRSGSASGEYPSLVYAGRVPGDPAGTLESEVVLKAGAGSQQSGDNRWGDYSSLTVDPTDDCTFWFTEEYETTTGYFNWSTAIGAFKFPGCPPAPNFSLGASPNTLTIAQGAGRTSTVTLTPSHGFIGNVTLAATGLPSGVTAGFSPNPMTSSSTATIAAAMNTVVGNYNVTLTGTSGGLTRTASLALTVGPAPSFTLTPSASKATVVVGSPAKITLTTAALNGFNSALALSVSGLPKGVTAGFSPTSIATPGSGSSKLTLTETAGAVSGTHNLTVTATGGGVTKTQPLDLTVVVPSFTMTLSSTSVSMKQGGTTPIKVTTAAINGFNAAIALSVNGLPKGVTASWTRTTIAAPGGGTSTLTLKAASGTNVGAYHLTVTSTGGGVTKTQSLTLTVTH